jgi:Family of unknown function (DUF5681)
MKRASGQHRIRGRKRANAPLRLATDPSEQEYRIGPGRPPKEYQFKPGQSGNPKGARRKRKSIAPDLKALFERALSEGDRHARRDLLALAERLGVDLVDGQGDALGQTVAAALSANDEALLADYVRRHAVQLDRPGEIDAGSHAESGNHAETIPAKNPIRRTDR